MEVIQLATKEASRRASAQSGTKRVAVQLTPEQIDLVTANAVHLPQQGQRTASRVIQALIEEAQAKNSWKRILSRAA